MEDIRDSRLVSPFQNEVLFVIVVNVDNGINRLTEPNQVMTPSAGVYFIFYYLLTTNTHKLYNNFVRRSRRRCLLPLGLRVGQGLGP